MPKPFGHYYGINISEGTQSLYGPGSVGSVAYGFIDDGDTGMWSSASNRINFSTGGSERMEIRANEIELKVPVQIDYDDGTTQLALQNSNLSNSSTIKVDANFNMDFENTSGSADIRFRHANNGSVVCHPLDPSNANGHFVVQKGDGGVGWSDLLNVDEVGLVASVPVEAASGLELPIGSAPAPALRCSNASTGAYFPDVNSWGISCNGGQTFGTTQTRVTSYVPHEFTDGSTAAPAITNIGDTNTGIFFPSDGEVGVTCDGMYTALFTSSLSSIGDGIAFSVEDGYICGKATTATGLATIATTVIDATSRIQLTCSEPSTSASVFAQVASITNGVGFTLEIYDDAGALYTNSCDVFWSILQGHG